MLDHHGRCPRRRLGQSVPKKASKTVSKTVSKNVPKRCGHRRRSFFVNLPRLYSTCRRKPDMAINGRRNKPFGPGGSTRRLHPIPASTGFGGAELGSTRGSKARFCPEWVRRYGPYIVANDNYAPVAQAA